MSKPIVLSTGKHNFNNSAELKKCEIPPLMSVVGVFDEIPLLKTDYYGSWKNWLPKNGPIYLYKNVKCQFWRDVSSNSLPKLTSRWQFCTTFLLKWKKNFYYMECTPQNWLLGGAVKGAVFWNCLPKNGPVYLYKNVKSPPPTPSQF